MSVHHVSAPVLLTAFAATGLAAWAGAGRRRGRAAVAGTMLAFQGGLHLLFSTTGAHDMGAGTPPSHSHMDSMTSMDLAGTAGMAAMDSANAGPGMLAVHLLAALLCGLWLAHGEAAFFTLAEAALAYAFTPLRLLLARVRVPDAPRGPVRRTRRSAHRPHVVVLAHTLCRRGPPRLAAPRATALGAQV